MSNAAMRLAGELGLVPPKVDFSNRTFNDLFVISFYGRKDSETYWLCRCVCGKEWPVRQTSLRRTMKCKECSIKKRTGKHITHGMTKRSEYQIWANMIYRCHTPTCDAYWRYGGRGIIVCDRWRNSFENFLADMGPRPSPKHSIDRYPDNNGNYEPGNCRWATDKEQMTNTSFNHFVEYNGKTQCLTDWSRETGINVCTLYQRLRKGYPKDQVFGIKKFPKCGRHNGRTKLSDDDVREIRRLHAERKMTLREIGLKFGLSRGGAKQICNRKSWAHIP